MGLAWAHDNGDNEENGDNRANDVQAHLPLHKGYGVDTRCIRSNYLHCCGTLKKDNGQEVFIRPRQDRRMITRDVVAFSSILRTSQPVPGWNYGVN